jgi:putative inorganic carbon (HCO3(-)) transporter
MIKRLRKLAAYLATIELPILSLFVLVSMVSTRALPWAVVVGLCFWLVRWLAYGYLMKRTPADLSIILLAIMVPVTLWATALPEITHPQVYRLLTGMLLYYAVVNWTTTTLRFRLVTASIIITSVILAIFATISVEWAFDKLPLIPIRVYDYLPTLVQDTIHRNVMSGNLIIILPITLGLLLFTWKQFRTWERIFLASAAIIVTAILFIAQTRGALIAFGVILLVLFTLRFRWGWVLIPLTSLGVLAAIKIWGFGATLEAVSSRVSLGGMQGRVEIWSRALYMIQDFPFTGIGMGSFGDVVDILYPLFLNAPGSVPHAHNLFFQVAVDLGIPGLIAWLSILLIMIVISWQVYRAGCIDGNNLITGVGAGLLGSLLALAVQGIVDSVTWGMVRPAPIVWVLWGLAVASWNLFYVLVRQQTSSHNAD